MFGHQTSGFRLQTILAMDTLPVCILFYPYQYQAFVLTFLILLPFGLAGYGIYMLIIWKMYVSVKRVFHKILMITGISILMLFFAEITVTLITIHHVNKQLGFSYSTPETKEGEFFLISKVIQEESMHKAGLKPGDRVLILAVNDLYIQLIENQEKEVSIPILRNNKEIEIKLIVPKLDIPLSDISFLF